MIPEISKYEYPTEQNVDPNHPILKQWEVIDTYFKVKRDSSSTSEEKEYYSPLSLKMKRKYSPLNIVVQEENLTLCQQILELGGNPNQYDAQKRTALHIAARFNKTTDIAKLLLKNNAFIEARANVEQTPLLVAVAEKNKNIAAYLLENGAAPNTQDSTFWTPLHYACSAGQVELCQMLLNHNAATTLKNKWGLTALEMGRWCRFEERLELLFQQYAAKQT